MSQLCGTILTSSSKGGNAVKMDLDWEELGALCDEADLYEAPDPEADISSKRSAEAIASFLGNGRQIEVPLSMPLYYGDLLSLALQRYIVAEGWEVIKVIGPDGETPQYIQVNTDYGKYEGVLAHGYLLLQKECSREVAFIRVRPRFAASPVISSCSQQDALGFAEGIENYADARKMYQGKKLELAARIHFIDVLVRSWDDLALDSALKEEIQANTVDFLSRLDELARYGIPPRRGVILAGEPGTGKTLVLKIFMNHSPGMTCIAVHEAFLSSHGYISQLYSLAQDLKPSIVFIEDIDLVGQDRGASHYTKGEGLFALLKALDGIEQCEGVVTVATTNSLQKLDRALAQWPSRFDRTIELPPPPLPWRRALIRSIAQKIPMDEDIQEYVAVKTDGYMPAQMLELAYSLVITHKHGPFCDRLGNCRFSLEEVKNVMRRKRKNGDFGFRKASGNGNNEGVDAIAHCTVLDSASKMIATR